ncbi:MAG: hypothetical protein A3K67_03815 [Euryarchaeota archaeon RBG_16_62_10]|nr:MAG: hypothetical protein A3K67_03815 [Euryarchaeota archaeon RBG_16_62_10]
MRAEGRVWKFGDDINTDLIIPGKYLDDYDPAHLASHAMEGASKDFARAVSIGDVIVAGRNFGCGSSREQAVIALKHAGVSALVARSFARIFYRNAVNLGLTVVVSENAHEVFKDGDRAVLDFDTSIMASSDGSKTAGLDEMPAHIRIILENGGLIPFLKHKLAARGREL